MTKPLLGDLMAFWCEEAAELRKRLKELGPMGLKDSYGAGDYSGQIYAYESCAVQLEIALKRVNATIDEILTEAGVR